MYINIANKTKLEFLFDLHDKTSDFYTNKTRGILASKKSSRTIHALFARLQNILINSTSASIPSSNSNRRNNKSRKPRGRSRRRNRTKTGGETRKGLLILTIIPLIRTVILL
jgi:hypothetical protein